MKVKLKSPQGMLEEMEYFEMESYLTGKLEQQFGITNLKGGNEKLHLLLQNGYHFINPFFIQDYEYYCRGEQYYLSSLWNPKEEITMPSPTEITEKKVATLGEIKTGWYSPLGQYYETTMKDNNHGKIALLYLNQYFMQSQLLDQDYEEFIKEVDDPFQLLYVVAEYMTRRLAFLRLQEPIEDGQGILVFGRNLLLPNTAEIIDYIKEYHACDYMPLEHSSFSVSKEERERTKQLFKALKWR